MTKSTESQRRTGKVTFCLFVVLFIHPWLLHRLLHDLAIPTWSCESSCKVQAAFCFWNGPSGVWHHAEDRTTHPVESRCNMVKCLSLSLSLSLNFRTTDGGVDPAPELGHSSLKTEKSVDFFENTISKLIIQPNVCWQWLCWTFFYTCRHRNFEFLIYG